MASDKNQSSSCGKSKEKVSMTDKALKAINDLFQYLPTGSAFLFQTLNPIITLGGNCVIINQIATGVLLVICAFACVFSCFTDSYMGSDGLVHYGIATTDGIWPSPASDNIDMSTYKITLGDFVDAFWTLIVFVVVVLVDPNTIKCFYPMFSLVQPILAMLLPPLVGLVVSGVFFLFPKKRHGIGNPVS